MGSLLAPSTAGGREDPPVVERNPRPVLAGRRSACPTLGSVLRAGLTRFPTIHRVAIRVNGHTVLAVRDRLRQPNED